MNSDDTLLARLAWGLILDWRRRRDVDPASRRAWVRLYLGVIRRARGPRRAAEPRQRIKVLSVLNRH